MAGRYRQAFIAAWDARLHGSCSLVSAPVVRASASPAAEPFLARDDKPDNRTAAGAIAGCDQTLHSIPGGRRSMKKNFVAMTLAAVTRAVSRACRSLRRSR